jgi:hypothetical protein
MTPADVRKYVLHKLCIMAWDRTSRGRLENRTPPQPMIVFPDRFGIRLEGHILRTERGPQFFTEPAKAPSEPFAG